MRDNGRLYSKTMDNRQMKVGRLQGASAAVRALPESRGRYGNGVGGELVAV